MTVTRTRTLLTDFIYLHTKRSEDPLTFSYDIECTVLHSITFTLNFEGSDNFQVLTVGSLPAANRELKLTCTARPFARQEVGSVSIIDMDKRASLRFSCAWILGELNDYEAKQFMDIRHKRILFEMHDAEKLNFPKQIDDPSLKRVQEICSQFQRKFMDLEFPPVPSSVVPKAILVQLAAEAAANNSSNSPKTKPPNSKFPSSATNNNSKNKRHYDQFSQLIEWKRPSDFMSKSDPYEIFSNEPITSHDIRPGVLGDSWLLGALATLAETPSLIEGLFPYDSKVLNNSGVYQVKLCKNGQWKQVRIDDCFPCYPGAGPIFSRNGMNALWVMLVEKAFAKLHGSYANIRCGFVADALIDMTGAPSFRYRLEKPSAPPTTPPTPSSNDTVWSKMLRAAEEKYVMCLSTPGELETSDNGRKEQAPIGLLAGHAYAIIAIKATSKGDRLVKFRNPWKKLDWKGDWSDASTRWTERMQAEVESLVKKEDDTIWMSMDDIIKYFQAVNVCYLRPVGIHPKPWKEIRKSFWFEFERISTVDECCLSANSPNEIPSHALNNARLSMSLRRGISTSSNDSKPTPSNALDDYVNEYRILSSCYVLTVHQKGTMILGIHQEDEVMVNGKAYLDIGIAVLKADATFGTMELIHGVGNLLARQNFTTECELDIGKYIVVPFTSGSRFRHYVESFDKIQLMLNEEELLPAELVSSPRPTGGNNSFFLEKKRSFKGGIPGFRKKKLSFVKKPVEEHHHPHSHKEHKEHKEHHKDGSGSVKGHHEEKKDASSSSQESPHDRANLPVIPVPSPTKEVSHAAAEEIDFIPDVYRVFTEVFHRMDADKDGYLSKEELDAYMLRTEGIPLEPLAYQWLVHHFDSKEAPGMSLTGFLKAQVYMFNKTGADEEKLWHEFSLLGYDLHLQCRNLRECYLSIHSTSSHVTLDTLPFDESAYSEAQELIIMQFGEKTLLEGDKIVLYKYQTHGEYGTVSLLIENASYHPLIVQMDCTEGENVVSHRGELIHQEYILPNQRSVMHHLSPKTLDMTQSGGKVVWSWAYTVSYIWDDSSVNAPPPITTPSSNYDATVSPPAPANSTASGTANGSVSNGLPRTSSFRGSSGGAVGASNAAIPGVEPVVTSPSNATRTLQRGQSAIGTALLRNHTMRSAAASKKK